MRKKVEIAEFRIRPTFCRFPTSATQAALPGPRNWPMLEYRLLSVVFSPFSGLLDAQTTLLPEKAPPKLISGSAGIYQASTFSPGTELKWSSLEETTRSNCRAEAAIHMSLSGIGRPFFFNSALMIPYSLAVSSSHARTVVCSANSSIRAMFWSGRAEFLAPKYNSPRTVTEINTSSAAATRSLIFGSPENKAITMLESMRKLPLTRIDLLAALVDRLAHRACVVTGYLPGKPQQV